MKEPAKAVRPEKPSINPPRDIAIRTYRQWLKNPVRIDNLVSQVLKKELWDGRDRAFYMELVYGVVRWHGRLEWILTKLSRREITADPMIVSAVKVGLYQLLMLDRVPDYAVVDSAVSIARHQGGPSAGGWVNAVLRKCAANRDHWRDAGVETGTLKDRLSIRYSYPAWMISRWLKRYPLQKLEEYLIWNNRRPEISLRVGRGEDSVDKVTTYLTRRKITVTVSDYDSYSLRISHSGHVEDLRPVREGRVAVQDISQTLVAYLIDPKPGEKILDLCSAPGGKTGHIAELCPTCEIIATDKSDERLETVSEMVKLREFEQVEVKSYQDVINSTDKYDAILVDAPCTGTGVLARRPDLRWRRSPGDIKRMAAVQMQLLNYAANRVKPGGRIIYSTCSIEPEENEGTVNEFLRTVKRFNIARGEQYLPDSFVDQQGCLRTLGPEIMGDGAFAVRFE